MDSSNHISNGLGGLLAIAISRLRCRCRAVVVSRAPGGGENLGDHLANGTVLDIWRASCDGLDGSNSFGDGLVAAAVAATIRRQSDCLVRGTMGLCDWADGGV